MFKGHHTVNINNNGIMMLSELVTVVERKITIDIVIIRSKIYLLVDSGVLIVVPQSYDLVGYIFLGLLSFKLLCQLMYDFEYLLQLNSKEVSTIVVSFINGLLHIMICIECNFKQ